MKYRHNILIVEDDESTINFFKKSLNNENYCVFFVEDPERVLKIMSLFPFQFSCAFIDCLLPRMNGMALLQKMRSEGFTFPVCLMSGALNEQSIAKFQPEGFLKKPLDVKKIEGFLKKHLINENQDQKYSPLIDLCFKDNPKAKIDFSNFKDLQSFEVLFCLSTIRRLKKTGRLDITFSKDLQLEKACIYLHEGKISGVNWGKQGQEFLEKEMIQRGLLSSKAKNLKLSFEALKEKIPEYLLSAILRKKTETLLNDLLKGENSVSLSFSEEELPEFSSQCLVDQSWLRILNNFLSKDMNSDQILKFFLPVMEEKFYLKESISDTSTIMSLDFVAKNASMLSYMKESEKMKDFLNKMGNYKTHCLFLLFILLIENKLLFKKDNQNKKEEDIDRLSKRLAKTLHRLENSNFFEIFRYLGASQNCDPVEVEKLYKYFSFYTHPDRVSREASSEVKKLSENIFKQIHNAYSILTNEEKRQSAEEALTVEKEKDEVHGQLLYQKALQLIRNRKWEDALSLLEKGLKIFQIPEIKLQWVRVQIQIAISLRKPLSPDIEQKCKSILASFSNKEEADYNYTYGLLYKYLQNLNQARKYFEKALTYQVNHSAAQHEINLLKKQQKSNSKANKIMEDIGTVITKIFSYTEEENLENLEKEKKKKSS